MNQGSSGLLGPSKTAIFVETEQTSAFAYALLRRGGASPWVVLMPDADSATRLLMDLETLGANDVVLLLDQDHTVFHESAPDPGLTFERCALRHRLAQGDRPRFLIVAADALFCKLPERENFTRFTQLWVAGEDLVREDCVSHLLLCGYNRVNVVEDEGTFALRGGIIDLFRPGDSDPIRLDFFGDELTSVHTFDPSSQKLGVAHDALELFPIRDIVFDPDAIARARERLTVFAEEHIIPSAKLRETLEDIENQHYFYGIDRIMPAFARTTVSWAEEVLSEDVQTAWYQPDQIRTRLEARSAEIDQAEDRARDKHVLALPRSEHYVDLSELGSIPAATLVGQALVETGSATEVVQFQTFDVLKQQLRVRRENKNESDLLEPLIQALDSARSRRHEFVMVCGRGRAERLRESLRARKRDLPVWDALPPLPELGKARREPRSAFAIGNLSSGFRDDTAGVALLTEQELFDVQSRRRSKRRRPAATEGLSTLQNLTPGDHVIHVDHGIGLYKGLVRLVLSGMDGDFVHLEYADGDKLYVPIYRLSLLQQYRGSPGDVRYDKLGGTRWEKTKQKVKDAVLSVAHHLIELQAARKAQPGFALDPPDDQYSAFEAAFPFEETPDQKKAIEKVIDDLTKPRPMDRLVCGDVGFGKTEVAMRGAFLTVLSGRQVAVLVPTTVLAEQHRQSFSRRMEEHGVRVEVLSRFRTAKDVKRILEETRAGTIDILIGTHKLLGNSVEFKNLGLLVVDEEQRFGVKHKERIKQMRSHVHVLTMSATPIPRTLNMAMFGLRDLSLITTPPLERVAIRTEVARFDEELIQEAIRSELRRGGQVFIVHNRIQTIGGLEETIRTLVPEARIVVGHGQMTAENLERIMVGFVQREYDVLLSTAIIESGIDIPAANTMIVDRADTFGLSQLYQLRGRIGRGRDRAFAYLLLPRSDRISKEASERLGVLKRHSELGAGFHIASHDMDIRGAGDLLGTDQSGSIAAVGFDLYSELLAEAVQDAKGTEKRETFEPEIKIPVTAMLPDSYVPDPVNRLNFYQRMSRAETDQDVYDVREEIEARYGEAPDEAINLVELMVVRRRLHLLRVSLLSAAETEKGLTVGLTFLQNSPVDRQNLIALVQREPARYRLTPSGRLGVELPTTTNDRDRLRALKELLSGFAVQ